jgi:hypothetical protein
MGRKEENRVMRSLSLTVAVSLILATVGCDSLTKYLNSPQGAAVADALLPAVSFTALATNGHVYYSATVDATSVSLQNLLRALNLPVTVSQDGNGVRIASALPDGARFTLVVQETKTADGGTPAKQTYVFIKWDNPSDGGRGFQVLAQLETQHQKPPTTPAK